MKKAPELLQHLERKHQLLELELGALLSQTHVTAIESCQVNELKKRKLVAKDGIAALRQQLTSL